MFNRIGRASLLLSVSILAAVPAMAQTNSSARGDASGSNPAGSTETGESQNMGEIIVTATKRETTVQNTPLSISALGDKSIQNLGATSITQIARQVPGLNFVESDSGRTRVSIRGIQTAGESLVGLYYGETPLTGPSGTSSDPGGTTPNLDLFDVARVEVLRGPQGTLYGSGSMGGTLRVIFKEPNLERYEAATEEQIEGTPGGGVGGYIKLAASVPLITDKLAARVVLYHQQNEGWVSDPVIHEYDLNRAVLQGGRVMLKYKPTDALQFNVMALLQSQKYQGTSQWAPTYGNYVSHQAISSPANDRLQLYNLDSKWDVGFATITMANSYYHWALQQTNDNSNAYKTVINSNAYCGLYENTAPGSLLQLDGGSRQTAATKCTTSITSLNGAVLTPAQQVADYQLYANAQQPVGAYQPRYVRNFTNELRLSSNGHGPFSYTAGVFREDRKDEVDTLVFPGIAATGTMRQPVTDLGSRYVIDTVAQTAEFGEIGYKLFGDRLELTAGARHYHYKKVVSGQQTGYNYFNGQLPTGYVSIDAGADGFVKKFNAAFHVTRAIMFYATASQGFRPGGANITPGVPATNQVYGPDTLWNYEAGLKTQFFDHKVTFNVDGYRIDWSNLQVSVPSTAGNFSFLANVGGARVYGTEAELTVQPVRGLILNGSFNYTDAYLTADQTLPVQAGGTGIVAPSAGKAGQSLPNIPRYTGSAGAEYDWPIFSDFQGFARVDYTYTGREASYFNPAYAGYRQYGNYSLVNARIGIQKDKFGIFLFCNNLLNKEGVNVISYATGVPDYYSTTHPRQIGLNVRASY